MTFRKTWIWLLVPAVLASCAPSGDPGCAGWRPVRVADATVDYLASRDPQALAALIAHHEAGVARGCWSGRGR